MPPSGFRARDADRQQWVVNMQSVAEQINPPVKSPARRSDGPIDRVHLARYTLGSIDLELEILGLFAGQAPETLVSLKAARSAKEWRDAAHTLKGSARAVGAWHVAERAAEAEALKDDINPARRQAALRALGEALDEACRHIDGLIRAGA